MSCEQLWIARVIRSIGVATSMGGCGGSRTIVVAYLCPMRLAKSAIVGAPSGARRQPLTLSRPGSPCEWCALLPLIAGLTQVNTPPAWAMYSVLNTGMPCARLS
jgi:hypothetical protein